MARQRFGILSRHHRHVLWTGRVIVAGVFLFLPALGAFVVYVWLDPME